MTTRTWLHKAVPTSSRSAQQNFPRSPMGQVSFIQITKQWSTLTLWDSGEKFFLYLQHSHFITPQWKMSHTTGLFPSHVNFVAAHFTRAQKKKKKKKSRAIPENWKGAAAGERLLFVDVKQFCQLSPTFISLVKLALVCKANDKLQSTDWKIFCRSLQDNYLTRDTGHAATKKRLFTLWVYLQNREETTGKGKKWHFRRHWEDQKFQPQWHSRSAQVVPNRLLLPGRAFLVMFIMLWRWLRTCSRLCMAELLELPLLCNSTWNTYGFTRMQILQLFGVQ